MREHWKRLFPLAALLLALLAPHCRAAQPQVRGVWVSTVLNLDYPSAQGLDKAALRAEDWTRCWTRRRQPASTPSSFRCGPVPTPSIPPRSSPTACT